jgi:cell wall-associated NlpC family hydrolase
MGSLMPPTRLLLSMLCVVLALAAALVLPLPGRAEDGSTTPAPPEPAPTDATQVVPVLPVAKAKRSRKARPVRRTQFHLPIGKRIVDYAKHFRGVRYVYGGSSPRSGFDCSGFVRYVYAHFGVPLAHSSYAQFGRGRRIGRHSLRPGDLVFFDGLGHVGIYVGNGHFIHAPHAGTRVRIETLAGWYGSRFDGARRLRAA